MKLIEFPEQTVIYAKDQPQYMPLPAHRVPDSAEGEIIFCWHMTWRERMTALFTGRLWHFVLTFNKPLQPQAMSVTKPSMQAQP